MTYSYFEISQYLTCPRRYRHRYLDGWKEKDTRAAMLFGRAFEQALGAYFRREDPGAVLFAEWSACQNQALHYGNRDSWDRMLRQRSCCWTVSARTIGSRSSSLDGICRSSSPGPSARRTTSLPTSMPSEDSTDGAPYWNGKPLPADTRKDRKSCSPSILSMWLLVDYGHRRSCSSGFLSAST